MGRTGPRQTLPEGLCTQLNRLQREVTEFKSKTKRQQVAQAVYVMTKQVRPGLIEPERNIEPRVRKGN